MLYPLIHILRNRKMENARKKLFNKKRKGDSREIYHLFSMKNSSFQEIHLWLFNGSKFLRMFNNLCMMKNINYVNYPHDENIFLRFL